MKVALLLTGDELMSGDIVDSNSSMIAQSLQQYGWRIACKSTVGDNLALLINEIKRLAATHDVLIINGGLGPTVDDLTAQALADASHTTLQENASALTHLQTWCERLHIPLNAANYKQAVLPEHCDIIPNPVGSAVGFELLLNNCYVTCTPGVPRELRPMLDETILPKLQNRFASESIITTRLVSFGLGESTLQEIIDQQFPDWPTEISLGFRASVPTVEIKLTIRNPLHIELCNVWKEKIITMLGEYYLGEHGCSLAEAAITSCRKNHKTLVTAESCTGGMIASQLTQIAGASDVFVGGFISYSNAMKNIMLDIPLQIIEQQGAVSQEIVKLMASQALKKSGADLVFAVTGIAGPSGGSPEKPVGSVWICWGDQHTLQTDYLLIKGNRQQFQQGLSAVALDLIRRCGQDYSNRPDYLDRRRHPALREKQ